MGLLRAWRSCWLALGCALWLLASAHAGVQEPRQASMLTDP